MVAMQEARIAQEGYQGNTGECEMWSILKFFATIALVTAAILMVAVISWEHSNFTPAHATVESLQSATHDLGQSLLDRLDLQLRDWTREVDNDSKRKISK